MFRSILQNLSTKSRTRRRAFTLVEILIVVVILGILAAIVIPQFTNAAQSARETTLKDLTRHLRMQVTMYKNQHRDISPGLTYSATTATEAVFIEQMIQYSDEEGNVSTSSSGTYKYGPYLEKIPANPMSNLNTLKLVANGAAMPAADNTTGWIYKPETAELVPNTTGVDEQGVAFTSY